MFFSLSLFKIFFQRIYSALNDNPTNGAPVKSASSNSLTEGENMAESSKNIQSTSNRTEMEDLPIQKSNSEENTNYDEWLKELLPIDMREIEYAMSLKESSHPYVKKFCDKVLEWLVTYNALLKAAQFNNAREFFK